MCAEHKKPTKLLKHLAAVKAAAEGQRNPPRMLVFANRIKVRPDCRNACCSLRACLLACLLECML